MTQLSTKQLHDLAERKKKQLFFDIVVKRMRQQGSPGTQNNTALLRCGTKKCSLGWLITDQFYEERFEKMPPNEVMIDILGMPSLGYQFYDDIQAAHDKSAKAKHWWTAFTNQMAYVARKHFLDPSSLTAPA